MIHKYESYNSIRILQFPNLTNLSFDKGYKGSIRRSFQEGILISYPILQSTLNGVSSGLTETWDLISNDESLFDISNLPDGVYVLRVTDEKNELIHIEKIVILNK